MPLAHANLSRKRFLAKMKPYIKWVAHVVFLHLQKVRATNHFFLQWTLAPVDWTRRFHQEKKVKAVVNKAGWTQLRVERANTCGKTASAACLQKRFNGGLRGPRSQTQITKMGICLNPFVVWVRRLAGRLTRSNFVWEERGRTKQLLNSQVEIIVCCGW